VFAIFLIVAVLIAGCNKSVVTSTSTDKEIGELDADLVVADSLTDDFVSEDLDSLDEELDIQI
jgi:hypothetical protein